MIAAREATIRFDARINRLAEDITSRCEVHEDALNELVESSVEEGIEKYAHWGVLEQSYDEMSEMLGLPPDESCNTESRKFESCSVMLGIVNQKLEDSGFCITDGEASSDGWRVNFEWPSSLSEFKE